jgi:small subunit ribosomal protein S17
MRKTLEGKVKKLSSEKTISVEVETKFPHPKYKKIVKKSKKYLVHNDGSVGDIKVGSRVIIQECNPVSKRKSWTVIKILD